MLLALIENIPQPNKEDFAMRSVGSSFTLWVTFREVFGAPRRGPLRGSLVGHFVGHFVGHSAPSAAHSRIMCMFLTSPMNPEARQTRLPLRRCSPTTSKRPRADSNRDLRIQSPE